MLNFGFGFGFDFGFDFGFVPPSKSLQNDGTFSSGRVSIRPGHLSVEILNCLFAKGN